MNKTYVRNYKPKTNNSARMRTAYLITNNFTPLIAQYIDNKSLLLGFTYKKDAIQFANVLETYYMSNYIWPQLNLEDTFSVFTNTNTYNVNRLDILDIHAWNYRDLTEYCKYSICDLAIIQNKVNTKHNIITCNIYIENIESSIDDMVNMCTNMYNTYQ